MDVGHIPGGYSLFAIPKLLANGSLRGNNEIGLQLTRDEATLKFDIRVKTPKGYVWAMYAPSRREGETVLAKAIDLVHDETAEKRENQLKGKVKLQSYHVIHSQLGHMGEEATRKVARYFDWQITQGTSSPCIACSEIKVKKKSFGVKAN
jgi:hypothetical protein